MRSAIRIAALPALFLLLPACSLTGSAPPPAVVAAPATPSSQQLAMMQSAPPPSGEPIQYFRVPADGRAALLARLDQLTGGPENRSDVRISNAWRTAASAAKTPNDYAACISAKTAGGLQTWMVVVSGTATGDAFGGPTGQERCSDPTRVTTWESVT
jgi:hypothetical protein